MHSRVSIDTISNAAGEDLKRLIGIMLFALGLLIMKFFMVSIFKELALSLRIVHCIIKVTSGLHSLRSF